MTTDAPPAQTSAPSTRALRLTFEFDGDNVQLVSQQRVEMRLPPSDPIEGYEGHKGFWCELRDTQDHTIYRRIAPHPVRPDVEVFSPEAEQNIQRHPVNNQKGVFVALVPDTAQSQDVVLSGSPVVPKEVRDPPARELARFRLAK